MDKELNYNTQALAYTLVIYATVLLLCYLTYISIPYTQTQIEQGGIEVNYGNSDQGKGDDFTSTESPSTSPKIKTKIASPVKAPQVKSSSPVSSNEKEIRTQNNEEADAVRSASHSNKKAITYQGPINASPRPPKVNTNALYKGPTSTGNGGGDGNTGQPGNQGSLDGSVSSRNYSGSGTGGGGMSFHLAGRKFATKPKLEDDGQSEGIVFVSFTFDRKGNIFSVEAGGRGTTIQNEALWRKCENAVTRAKISPISSGPEIQQGDVTFVFKLN